MEFASKVRDQFVLAEERNSMHQLRWGRHRRRGFTIIELVVVVAMIGLLTLIAAPHIDYMRVRLDASARTVATTMLASQREAVSRQHDIVVLFDQPNASLRVLFDANNSRTRDAGERVRVVPLDEHVVFGRAVAPALPFGVDAIAFTRQVDGMPAVTFHRNGSASEAGGVYLTSTRALNGASTNPDDRAVELVRATGQAITHRFTGSAWTRSGQ